MSMKWKKRKMLALTLAALVMGGSAVHAVAGQADKSAPKSQPHVLLYKPAVSMAGQEGASFVGVKACAKCHPNEHAAWSKTGHAGDLPP